MVLVSIMAGWVCSSHAIPCKLSIWSRVRDVPRDHEAMPASMQECQASRSIRISQYALFSAMGKTDGQRRISRRFHHLHGDVAASRDLPSN
jgi:hypothetical protein